MPDLDPFIPRGLGRYLEVRRAQHEADRNAVLAGMTKREQALIKDAAVMGYVQGAMAGRDREIPPDGMILASVLDGCLAMSDLYPAVRRAYRRGLRKADAEVPEGREDDSDGR